VVLERAEACGFMTSRAAVPRCLAAYSAVNQGHCHPEILRTLHEQAGKITLCSRASRNDQLPPLCKELHELTGYENDSAHETPGAEAVGDRGQSRRANGLQGQGILGTRAETLSAQATFMGAQSLL